MTVLETRYYESIPTILKRLEQEQEKLNDILSRLLTVMETGRASEKNVLQDSMPLLSKDPIKGPDGAVGLVLKELTGLDHEELWAVILDSECRPIKKLMVCSGSINQTIIDSRRIAKEVLNTLGGSVIIYHNHPSGKVLPSQADIKQTENLRKGLNCFDIELIDHIIIGIDGKKYYSFADGEVKSLKTK